MNTNECHFLEESAIHSKNVLDANSALRWTGVTRLVGLRASLTPVIRTWLSIRVRLTCTRD